MHSYLRAVGFSDIKSREGIKEIIGDTVRNYDEKVAVEDHKDGAVSYTHLDVYKRQL